MHRSSQHLGTGLHHWYENETDRWLVSLVSPQVMHNNAGVYRTDDLLKDGCTKVTGVATHLDENLLVRWELIERSKGGWSCWAELLEIRGWELSGGAMSGPRVDP